MEILKQSSIAVLDDDRAIITSMCILLEDYFGEVCSFSNPEDLIDQLLKRKFDVLLMDMNYSSGAVDGKEGLNLLDKIREVETGMAIVVMTAYSDVVLAVECMRAGASDFVTKPWSNERLIVTLSNVLKMKNSNRKVEALRIGQDAFDGENKSENMGMIGSSKVMEKLRYQISQVSDSDVNVLILGENGTGKELVAKALHENSGRKQNPLVKIDLGTIHDQLFESELFGAKKGSYSGLMSDKPGRMALADKGTLFLDEIANLSLSLQSKLLSVLQNRELYSLGSVQAQKIDVRLVSATNAGEEFLKDQNQFRQDLLYRINTIEIVVPSLRERSEDIPELVNYFVDLFTRKYKKAGMRIEPDALKQAKRYAWPGNVRQLEHAVERAVLLGQDSVSAENLVPSSAGPKSATNGSKLNLEEIEKAAIQKALKTHAGNITKASKELGLSRTALYRRLEKYEL